MAPNHNPGQFREADRRACSCQAFEEARELSWWPAALARFQRPGEDEGSDSVAQRMRLVRCAGACLALTVCASGCSGGDASGGGRQGSEGCTFLSTQDTAAFEGIYSLTRYTRNETACDVEGPSVLESQAEGLLYIGPTSFAGISNLLVQSCTTADDCRTKYAAALDGGFGSSSWILFQFSCSGGAGTVHATIGTTGFSGSDGMCREPSVSHDVLTRQGDSLRLESRTSFGPDYAAEAEGFCTTDLGYAAAKDQPCTRFEVLEASFIEPL
jgi:hypothetical protein